MLMVPPKIAPKQWDYALVTEMLVFSRALSRRNKSSLETGATPGQARRCGKLMSRMKMGARLLDNTNFDVLRRGML
jgi:hypothetical protein